MCSLVPFHIEKTLCKQSLKLLESRIPQIKTKYTSFTELIKHRRCKRGIINGVGSVLKTLFGTMDDNDAQYYNDAINRVISDNKHFKNLLQDQTQIIQDTLITFNNTITEFNICKRKLNENITMFNNFSNFIENFTEGIKVSQLVTEHTTLLLQITQTLDDDFDNLISVILFAQRN
jgi:hypothetical protein